MVDQQFCPFGVHLVIVSKELNELVLRLRLGDALQRAAVGFEVKPSSCPVNLIVNTVRRLMGCHRDKLCADADRLGLG